MQLSSQNYVKTFKEFSSRKVTLFRYLILIFNFLTIKDIASKIP